MAPAVEPVLSKGGSFSFAPYIVYIRLYIFICFKATGKPVLSDVISAHQLWVLRLLISTARLSHCHKFQVAVYWHLSCLTCQPCTARQKEKVGSIKNQINHPTCHLCFSQQAFYKPAAKHFFPFSLALSPSFLFLRT